MHVLIRRRESPLLAGIAATNELEQRAISAYLGLAIGDAFGATVEFLTPREIKAQYGEHRELIGGGWLHLKRGQVTDDTEMSLALGDSILQCGQVDAVAAAEAFSAWMRTKPVDIGNTVRRGIAYYRRTGATCVPENTYDAGNGACMRCLPVALATLGADLATVVQTNQLQAHITHHNAQSDHGCECVIQMVQAALLGEKLPILQQHADALVATDNQFAYQRKREENPSAFIVETLRAVFQTLVSTDNFEQALIDVVNRGGDADTTGAIVGMIAGALYGSSALPARWLEALDRHTALRVIEQARALLELSPLRQHPV
ncbi:ADP-ribosyl-[dinitrogen reductase] hydrolase [Rhodoferax sp. 4810]|uniref:ADP-ribosyl-[dinitrogen reductase] hydrolase n=1 Tax=Thiospirillum jenense TaxID=1653858 RepID=A0A839HCL5_9GAMM|nr:ADP-ribosyl-[dinitrogen reductase] hydrolase [Thiospirillum jenense]MBB1073060.1 ADP-ribosyl-[dinitrogen reductase] hydrolase [Rhodoferax jenense]MBB1125008.1 ADP-ribosyl-[dinitrogen reductase] hydrolase [Thiospirillum jenense]